MVWGRSRFTGFCVWNLTELGGFSAPMARNEVLLGVIFLLLIEKVAAQRVGLSVVCYNLHLLFICWRFVMIYSKGWIRTIYLIHKGTVR